MAYCCCSVAQLCPTLCDPWTAACQASLSATISQSILKLMPIESVMPSNPSHLLSSPSPPAFNLSQHQGLFQLVGSSHQVVKVLELQFQHQSLQWISLPPLLWLVPPLIVANIHNIYIYVYNMCVYVYICYVYISCGSDCKESACSVWGPGLIAGLGRSPGEGNGFPLQYSCLEYSMVRGVWQAAVHGVTNSQTWLSNFTFFLSFLYIR